MLDGVTLPNWVFGNRSQIPMEMQGTLNSQNSLKKNKAERVTLSDFKLTIKLQQSIQCGTGTDTEINETELRIQK